MTLTLPPESGQFMVVLSIAFVVATVIVHIGFALAVLTDANDQVARRCGPWFVGPFIWSLATLLGGVFVAAAYWAMHHSTLRGRLPRPSSNATPPPSPDR